MIRILPVLVLMLAARAAAQISGGGDGNAPIVWSAEHVELQSRTDRLVVSGNVRITKGTMKLDADHVTVAYSRAPSADQPTPEINRIDASGNVVFTRGDQIASGSMAIYDLDQRIVTMLGKVELNKGATRLSGSRLIIDLESGFSTINGRSSDAGGGGGRVTATFSAPKSKTP